MAPSTGKILRGLGLAKKKHKKKEPPSAAATAPDDAVDAGAASSGDNLGETYIDVEFDDPGVSASPVRIDTAVQEVSVAAQPALNLNDIGLKWDSDLLLLHRAGDVDTAFDEHDANDSTWEEIELEAGDVSSRRSVASLEPDLGLVGSAPFAHGQTQHVAHRTPTRRLRVLFSQNSVMAKASESDAITVGCLDLADYPETGSLKSVLKFTSERSTDATFQEWGDDDDDSNLIFRSELAAFLTIRHPEPDHVLITLHGAKLLPVFIFPSARIARSFLAMLHELLSIHPSASDDTLLVIERETDRAAPGAPRPMQDQQRELDFKIASKTGNCSVAESMLASEFSRAWRRSSGHDLCSPVSPVYSEPGHGMSAASVDMRKPRLHETTTYETKLLSIGSIDHFDKKGAISKKVKQIHNKKLKKSRYRYLFYPARWLTAFEALPTADIADYEPTNFRPAERRGTPVSPAAWTAACKESTGEIRDPAALMQAIFEGGLEPAARPSVWPFLLGVWALDSTENSRQRKREEMAIQYATVKQQWMSIAAELEEARKRKKSQNVDLKKFERLLSAVSIDIGRIDFNRITNGCGGCGVGGGGSDGVCGSPIYGDRGHCVECGSLSMSMVPAGYNQTSYARKLKSVLLCIYFHQTSWIYPEGLASCLLPVVCAFEGDEVMSFWCFTAVVKGKMNRSFLEGESGPKSSLLSLRRVIEWVDPELSEYFKAADPTFLSCLRWILMHLALDVKPHDVPLLWETCWSKVAGGHSFILFTCAGVLVRHRMQILQLERNLGGIMRYVKDLSGRIDGQVAIHDAIEVYREIAAGDLRRTKSGSGVKGGGIPR